MRTANGRIVCRTLLPAACGQRACRSAAARRLLVAGNIVLLIFTICYQAFTFGSLPDESDLSVASDSSCSIVLCEPGI